MKRAAFWIAPSLTAALALWIYGPFGFGRDFGAFLIALLLVPLLAIVALILGVWALLDRKPERLVIVRSAFAAMFAPAVLIPALCFFGDPLRDPARFAVWKVAHPQELAAARPRDGVFKHWDGWGMAGNENDSYLASDPTDALSRPGIADRWAKAHHLGCDVAAIKRMERGIYLLTTYNCPIEGFPF